MTRLVKKIGKGEGKKPPIRRKDEPGQLAGRALELAKRLLSQGVRDVSPGDPLDEMSMPHSVPS
ncbi:MAG: hypothetical protein ABII71_00210, partial [Candidatus Micrarchaeota archaeon]